MTKSFFMRSLVVAGLMLPAMVVAQSYGSSSSSYEYCGNYMCDGSETITSCPMDCGSYSSSSSSSSSITFDGYCGNYICEVTESIASCPMDCGSYSSSSSSSSSSEDSSWSSSYSSDSSEMSSDSSSSSSAICGNWIMEGAEECDAGPNGDADCSEICLVKGMCSCECNDGSQKLCHNKKSDNYGQLCLNIPFKDAKSKTACDAKAGGACTGYPKDSNTQMNGTLKNCVFATSSSSSDTSSSSSEESSYSSY